MLPIFPNFVPLNFELKYPYNQLVKDLPPYSDISFATLQIWWNLNEQLLISTLNSNVIINYHQPFDAQNSGLSLIGKNDVDASIPVLFHYLAHHDQPLRIVHVPEFVVDEIKNLHALRIEEEPNYYEYLLDSSALANLEGHEYQLIRKKIKRFLRDNGESQIDLSSLDLSISEVQDELFRLIAEWENSNSTHNDPGHDEHLALKKSLSHANALDIKNLAVFIDKKLHGIIIYHQPMSKEHYVLHHLKANYQKPYISDYLHHQIAKLAASNNVTTLNIEMDLGIENIKKHKLTLRPRGFFKKFTIRPV